MQGMDYGNLPSNLLQTHKGEKMGNRENAKLLREKILVQEKENGEELKIILNDLANRLSALEEQVAILSSQEQIEVEQENNEEAQSAESKTEARKGKK